MGAGAAKQFQSEKANHAAIILEAVQAYERAHPGEVPSDNFSFQAHLFKRRVVLAAAESKRKGKDVDSSLHQLTDADLETLFHYIESNRQNKHMNNNQNNKIGNNSNNEQANSVSPISSGVVQINPPLDGTNISTTQGSLSDPLEKSATTENHTMTVEEFVEEDFNNGGDTIDETTSVLSYGDDDRDNDSEAEVESSGSLLIHQPSSKKIQDKRDSSGEILEDLDTLEEANRQTSFENGKKDPMRSSGMKIFPVENNSAPKERIAQTLAKFWEIDEVGSMKSLNLGMESPRNLSPNSPYVTKGDKTPGSSKASGVYKDRGQKIDERNERLMGLQRQKVMSYTQNAQLEREVEALQKQLERMEELERSMEPSSPSTSKLNHSMASSASTIQGSTEKSGSNAYSTKKNTSKYSYIYPIDEENDGAGSFRGARDHKSTPDSIVQKPNIVGKKHFHGAKATTYSSSDSEDDVLVQSFEAPRKTSYPQDIAESKQLHGQAKQQDGKENPPVVAQLKNLRHRRRPRAHNASASSGVDSDDSATSGASNHHARRVKNPQTFGNASDSDNAAQPLSARSKSNLAAPSPAVAPRRQVADKEKRTLSQLPNPCPVQPTPAANASVVSSNHNSPPKKTDARRARNTIGAEENKPRNSKPQNVDVVEETSSKLSQEETKTNESKQPQAINKKQSKRRHSVDGISPIKESPANIKIDDSITLEKAISVLKDVNNNSVLAMEKLITPEKRLDKEFEDAVNNKQRVGKIPVSEMVDKKSNDDSDATGLNKQVLNDDEFQALFAGDPAGDGIDATALPAPLKRRKPKNAPKKREVVEKVVPSAAEVENKDWSDELDQKWIEVSLLLRQPIKCEEDMIYAAASAEAGIMFTDQMNAIAKSLNVLRGQLSRWILPYDSNTRIETQCSTPHSVTESMPDEFRGKLTERQVHYLVAGANGVRKLVRIKIADDNDLEQARKALQTTISFFKELYERSEKLGLVPFELLQKGAPL